jgi:hypothetical protein
MPSVLSRCYLCVCAHVVVLLPGSRERTNGERQRLLMAEYPGAISEGLTEGMNLQVMGH